MNATHGVVAALAANVAGIHHEQSGGAVRCEPLEAQALGSCFVSAFDGFAWRDDDLTLRRPSDWPAFLVSGAASIQAFQRDYVQITCFACNASDAVVRAAAAHPTEPDVTLSVEFNPRSTPVRIGEHLLRLAAVARRS